MAGNIGELTEQEFQQYLNSVLSKAPDFAKDGMRASITEQYTTEKRRLELASTTPTSIDASKYMLDVPDELRQAAKVGLGRGYEQALFNKSTEGMSEQLAQSRENQAANLAMSGFDVSGFNQRAGDITSLKYAKAGAEAGVSAQAQNREIAMTAQNQISDIETRNAATAQTISDINRNHALDSKTLGWYEMYLRDNYAVQKRRINAEQEAEQKRFLGQLVGGALGFIGAGPAGAAVGSQIGGNI